MEEQTYSKFMDTTLSQFHIGQIELEGDFFCDNKQNVGNYRSTITVRSLKGAKKTDGWGDTIFSGTLEQLIDFINRANVINQALTNNVKED